MVVICSVHLQRDCSLCPTGATVVSSGTAQSVFYYRVLYRTVSPSLSLPLSLSLSLSPSLPPSPSLSLQLTLLLGNAIASYRFSCSIVHRRVCLLCRLCVRIRDGILGAAQAFAMGLVALSSTSEYLVRCGMFRELSRRESPTLL